MPRFAPRRFRRIRSRAAACSFGLALGVFIAACGGPPVPVPKTSERYDFEAGRIALQEKHHLDAQQHLKRFLDLNPGHALADSAQFLIGLSLYGMKSYAEAAIEFAILMREFPRSELRDDASYHECLCYHAQMRPAPLDPTFALRARACMNEFLLRYPESEWVTAARQNLQEITNRLAEKEFRIGVSFTKLKQYRAALVYFREVQERYPSSHWVPESLLWMARAYQGLKDSASATEHLERLIEGFPDHPSTEEARKLLGEIQHEQGDVLNPSDSAAREPR